LTTFPGGSAGLWKFPLLHEPAHLPELLVALLHQLLTGFPLELGQVAGEGLVESPGNGLVVPVCPAEGLLDDLVDDVQLLDVLGGQLQGLGGLGTLGAVGPEDGGAPFREMTA